MKTWHTNYIDLVVANPEGRDVLITGDFGNRQKKFNKTIKITGLCIAVTFIVLNIVGLFVSF
jgi:hypothetical protein